MSCNPSNQMLAEEAAKAQSIIDGLSPIAHSGGGGYVTTSSAYGVQLDSCSYLRDVYKSKAAQKKPKYKARDLSQAICNTMKVEPWKAEYTKLGQATIEFYKEQDTSMRIRSALGQGGGEIIDHPCWTANFGNKRINQEHPNLKQQVLYGPQKSLYGATIGSYYVRDETGKYTMKQVAASATQELQFITQEE